MCSFLLTLEIKSMRGKLADFFFFQQQARKHLCGFHLAGHFLQEKKPGVLADNSEWAFHNSEIPSACVLFMSVLVKGNGTSLVRRGDNRPVCLPGRGTVV